LAGIVLSNADGFGNIIHAQLVYVINELKQLQARFQQLKEWLGEAVASLGNYELPGGG
jgi:hypothetical protein